MLKFASGRVSETGKDFESNSTITTSITQDGFCLALRRFWIDLQHLDE